MNSILGYGCSTAAGPDSEALWSSLTEGRDHRSSFIDDGPKGFLWTNRFDSARARLLDHLHAAWSELNQQLPPEVQTRLRSGASLGIIFASTKGDVDDFIWNPEADLSTDGLTPVLNHFIQAHALKPARKIVVSNACTSGLAALFLADKWLNQGDLTDVLILAADTVGPFVMRGFECLRVLTADAVRPFAGARSGFHLGDAAATLLVSRKPGPWQLRGVGIDAEGFAVTRPDQSGASLKRACLSIPRLLEDPPDIILAHGTATQVNDRTEDAVYTSLFGSDGDHRPLVTGSKWCIGHTLGASGAVDAVIALMMLEKSRAFPLATTSAIDPNFHSRYFTPEQKSPTSFSRVLVSSLGFGGVHAAALLEKVSEQVNERGEK